MPDYYLPFDIQIEILKKLPIKPLIQFRSVSKRWKYLIDSSDFITAHYNNNNSSHARNLMLIRYQNQASEDIYVSIVDDETFPNNRFSFSPTFPTSIRDATVVGASHGLVCLFGYHRNPLDCESPGTKEIALLWNPTIRKSVAIDLPPNVPQKVLGFGVCPGTSDPKIVLIVNIPMQVEVFTLSSGVWRSSIGMNNVPHKSLTFRGPCSQVIVGGAIYWFGIEGAADPKHHLLISFDLSTEELKEIHLPLHLAMHDPDELFLYKHKQDSLALLKGCLMKRTYQVWIMQQKDSSFTNLFTVNEPDDFILLLMLPLEFRRNGEEIVIGILTSADTVVLALYQHLSEQPINDLGIRLLGRGRSLSVTSYTESLTLLDH